MDEGTHPTDVSLELEETDDIAEVFVGFTTADGTEVVLASTDPPVRVSLDDTTGGPG